MTRPLDESAQAGAALDYRLLAEADLARASSDRSLNLDLTAVGAAFARGDACVGAFDAGRLVGYLWYAFAATPHAGRVWVDFPSHARYAYKALLLPEYRGRGLGEEMYACAGAVCPRAGRTAGITYILMDNTASLVAAERAGWRTVGYAGYLNKAGTFLGWNSPGAERAGFRFWRLASVMADRPGCRPAAQPAPSA
jgi:GNAT superfamily N-acetyltransferase